MTPRSNLESIKADLRARLPLTDEQQRLFDESLKLARSVATNLLKKWKRHRWLDKDDLYNQAAVHLADAIQAYDPSRSPCIRGWAAKYVRWRLLDWLRNELREHDYKSFAPRPKPKKLTTEADCFLSVGKTPARKAARDVRLADEMGMTAGGWDHGGSYTEQPINRLIATETAAAVRRVFDPRNVEVFLDKWQGADVKDIAYRHNLHRSRVYEIVSEVRQFIAGRIADTGVKTGQVIGFLLERNTEARERGMRLLNCSPEDFSENRPDKIDLFTTKRETG